MKPIRLIVTVLCVVSIFAQVSFGKDDFKAEQPFLLTPAGQSSDALMVKILAQKANLEFTFDKQAQPDTLQGNKTLILVTGGSTKGLGAANIDKEDELKRIEKLIEAAKKNEIKIVTMHIGGKARRGKLSDMFNSLSAESADLLIVKKDGDGDNFFADIAKEKNIPIKYIEKILGAGQILTDIFPKQQ